MAAVRPVKPSLRQGVGKLLFGRFFVDIQCEGELRNQNLAGLDEHALLARAQAKAQNEGMSLSELMRSALRRELKN